MSTGEPSESEIIIQPAGSTTVSISGVISVANTSTIVSIVNTAGIVLSVANTMGIGIGFMDSNNAYRQVKIDDGKIRVIANSYYDAIAEGNIGGHRSFSKIGFSPNLAANVESDVWSNSGVYTFPTFGQPMSVTGTHAADSSGGIGAHFVTIYYLDTALASKSETVELAGLATTSTVATDIFRVNNFLVTSAGTFQKASGGIILASTTGTTRYNYITPTYTRARNAQYTVAAGSTLLITDVKFGFGTVNAGNDYARMFLRVNVNPVTGQNTGPIFYSIAEIIAHNNTIPISMTLPGRLPAGTDLKLSGLATAAGSGVAILRGWLES